MSDLRVGAASASVDDAKDKKKGGGSASSSSSSNGKEKETEQKEDNLWQQVLRDSAQKNHLLESKTVLLLGDRSTGKSSLIARIQGLDHTEASKDGVALDYTYLDVFMSDESDDVLARTHVWTLEGDVGHASLLEFAINEKTIGNSMVVIVLDFTQPWTFAKTLQDWLKVVEDHIEAIKLKLPKGALESLKKKAVLHFQNYKEPKPTQKGTSSSVSVTSEAPPAINAEHNPSNDAQLDFGSGDDTLLPLGEGVLTHNLGIPIVVVCQKVDMLEGLEKEYSYRDDHFTYIQQYLRRICLQYGATLLYTSAKRNIQCSLLFNYLKHRLYNFEFHSPAQVLEKDSLFVPSGWDSLAKIDIDFKNQNICGEADLSLYNEIIPTPLPFMKDTKISQYEMESLAEDDQEFLAKHLKAIEETETQRPGSPSSFDSSPVTPKRSSMRQASSKDLARPNRPSNPTTPVSSKGSSITSRAESAINLMTPSKAAAELGTPVSAAKGSPKGSSPSEHKVLSDFFNSLLTKDPRKSTAPGGSGSSGGSGSAIVGVTPKKRGSVRKKAAAPATSTSNALAAAAAATPSRKDAEASLIRLTENPPSSSSDSSS
ncbi:Cytoplasmic dynein 1 light intermediate chain 1 [Balamuthia mandrillaris]